MKNLITICLVFALIGACKPKDVVTPVSLPAAPATISVYPDDTKDSLVFESVFNSSSNVTSYNVYASTTAGFKGTVVGTVGTGTSPLSFVHKGLTNGTTYYYYVSAVCAAGEGAKSIEVSTTPHLPLSKTVSMLFQQYLPAVCQAAPYRYYDPSNAEYGKNPFAQTDTFKLFISYKAVAGHDTSIFYPAAGATSYFRPQDVILATFPEKWLGWVLNPGFNNTTPFVNIWLSSGDAYAQPNKILPGVWDTIPVTVKINNLIDLTKIASIWVRCTESGWFQNRLLGYSPAMYDKEIKIADFIVVEGFTKLDKSKPTIYHINGAYYFIIPVKNTRDSGFNIESTVKYSDGSQSSQMLVNGL